MGVGVSHRNNRVHLFVMLGNGIWCSDVNGVGNGITYWLSCSCLCGVLTRLSEFERIWSMEVQELLGLILSSLVVCYCE